MAEVTLRLRRDPLTGARELVIDYESAPDDLGFEHEQAHREHVEAALGAAAASARRAPVTAEGEQRRAAEVATPEAARRKT